MALTALLNESVVLWMAGHDLSSVGLLEEFLSTGANPRIAIVKNGFFGQEDSFGALKASRFADAPSVYLPAMPALVSNMLHSDRIPFGKGLETMSRTDCFVAEDALKKGMDCFDEALGKAARLS